SSIIIKNYDYIGLENLNTQGMMKNHKLAKSLVDVSFYEFNRQLEYKANYMQKEIHRVDKFYPSSKTCSCCGYIKEDLSLKDRIFDCPNCKTKLDRDYNASLNIYRVGASTLRGEFVRPTKVG
ncbi:RNA-guided endonuclease InsQ/TnpB family protein, partial [Helicobacter cinaedi]|uniref:RNA-guided endonuclease InsQ/TnpB family protein n=1 Tax=Helicobacter cinaedi TaxID=213 RepID=UPI001B330D9D